METVDAIRGALRLLSAGTPGPADSPIGAPSALPTAALLTALEEMTSLADPGDLAARHPDLRPLLAPILDWSAPSSTRATKVVVKAVATAMRTPGPAGLGFAAAVEMVGYLALWAPYLDADRLARVAALAPTTTVAYAPAPFVLGPSGQLGLLVGRYDMARREQLAVSLWNDVHQPRWYDVHVYHDLYHRRRRRVTADERAVIDEHVQSLTGGHRAPDPVSFLAAARARALAYSDEVAALVARIPEPAARLRAEIAAAVREADDVDVSILAAHLPWLAPGERPETPVTRVIALALAMNGGPARLDPATLPERPRVFRDLVPLASRELFASLEVLRDLDDAPLPGVPGSRIRVLASAHEISENAEYMRNCTRSYIERCLRGEVALLRVEHGAQTYNVAYRLDQPSVDLVEAKARFNQAVRSRAVLDGIERLRRAIATRVGRAASRA